MNIILLFIWICIILISLLCFYYNEKILTKFVEKNTPVQPKPVSKCSYTGIPVVELSKLSKCKMTGGVQSYTYKTSDGTLYEISSSSVFYTKACTGFCLSGISTTGNCKIPSNQKKLEDCENLIKPTDGCVSTAKPIVNVKDGKNTVEYFIIAPINSLNSCS